MLIIIITMETTMIDENEYENNCLPRTMGQCAIVNHSLMTVC